ncbi:transcription initiation at TATA-containing promoter protein [Neonectria magnoliae]|uniref:Transcription initiation at TATA-containing promoter protein n=1 Tax=Neonectria magnoliae TaxID=2732573 RepID=A0ABR1I8A6_9HYPO
MASPAPDTPVVDAKSRDSVSEKDQKSEVNGHATPVHLKDEPEKPAVNGNKDHGVTNGVIDTKMENGDAQTEPTNETAKETVKEEEATEESSTVTKVEPTTESTKTEESKPKSEEESVPVLEDVEMKDVTPPRDNKLIKDESEDAPTATEKKPEKDTETSDKPSDEPTPTDKVNGTHEVAPTSDDSALPTSEVDLQPASLSQLVIEPDEAESTTPKPSIEVTMEDAPTVEVSNFTKVARQREDDAPDEPAPKRAKTEPADDEPAPAVIVASSAPAEAVSQPETTSPFTRLPKWDDPEFNNQKITPYQRREIRKVLGRIKKTKQGGHFRDSVQKLWPGLWESYLAKIEKPTDLSEIDRTLRDANGAYVTISQFKKDLVLMYDNTLAFNGQLHDVTSAARGSIRAIWEDIITIPQEEPTKPKPAPKQKAPRESRTAHVEPTPTVKKQSSAPAPSPVVEAPPKQSSFTQDQANDLRRASTATDGDRPKRTVRAPKPKDIDYTTKPSQKKLKPELQFSKEVLSEMMHPKNKHINSWFMEAVDAEGLGIPHYYSYIKKPMDLGKVQRMLAAGDITSFKEFDKNIRLVFSNCYAFNGAVDQGNAVSYVAKQLEDFYNAQMKRKDSWLAKYAEAHAPPPTSHASDEEEEEEEFETREVAAPTVDSSKEIRELEAKLREESEKLTDLFAADSPNQSLIMVQQGILKMVQEALLKAKQSLSEYRQKHDKPSKKAGKPSKSKPSGSSAPRKPTGNAVPKKSGGTKKAAPKKNLNAADKDQIANAINDLEYPHLDRAIDIIKRDTGQAENNDGELELDIDQLSNDALLKLWELCKKVLPGFGKDSTGPVSSPEVTRAATGKQPKNAAKPKKNKPMSAREQEERIAQLRGLRDLYKPGQEAGDGQNVTQAPTPTAESSDDSDSEEE